MVFGNIRDRKDFAWLEETIGKCFDFAAANDLLSFEKGSHPIDGEDLFVNIVEYETTNAEDRFWEAHRQYLDLHFMLRGPEQIDVNFIDNMEQKDFVEKDDFLLCYPADAHRTAVKVDEPVLIKKAIFKIRIK